MRIRPLWIAKIEEAWRSRSVVWLSGVRRGGKTTPCRSLAGVGENFFVTADANRPLAQRFEEVTVTVLGLGDLVARLAKGD